MKTDKLFYEVFQEFPDIFFRLIGETQVNVRAYEFKAIELKETSLRLDGVMLRVAKDLKEPIYFIEVQSYKNDDIYLNLLMKVTIYLKQNDSAQNWFGVVIYERRSLEPEPEDSESYEYEWLLNTGKILRIYLDEIDLAAERNLGIGLVKLIVEKEKNAVSFAKQLIAQTRSESTDDEQTSKMLELIETIIVYKFADKSREELQAMLGLEDIKETKLGKELLAEGRQEGLQEGEQLGRLKGKLEVVPVMLNRGFTFEEVAELLNLELDQVRQVTQPERPSQFL